MPLFYDKELYLRSSFQGRRWVAHSGSDADDFIVLFGTANETKSLIFSFNIERRGIFSKTYPEHKFESSIIATRRFESFNYKLYIENEKYLIMVLSIPIIQKIALFLEQALIIILKMIN